MPSRDGFTAEIRVENLRELQRELRAVDRELPRELRTASKNAAEVVADTAEREAPRRSGKLSRSVGVAAQQRGAQVKAGTAARVPYAAPIHFGWRARGIAANPFLYRALAKTSDRAREIYETRIRDLAARIATRG